MTVAGPIPVKEMRVTLMHEHILIDGAKSWACPCHPDLRSIAEQPASFEIIGELRMNPYINRDNVSPDDGGAEGRRSLWTKPSSGADRRLSSRA